LAVGVFAVGVLAVGVFAVGVLAEGVLEGVLAVGVFAGVVRLAGVFFTGGAGEEASAYRRPTRGKLRFRVIWGTGNMVIIGYMV